MARKYDDNIKQIVLELIPEGKKNALPASYFIGLTGLTRRQFTDIISILREDYPICADKQAPGGYWLGNEQDCLQMERDMHAVMQTCEKTQKQFVKHYSKIKVGKI